MADAQDTEWLSAPDALNRLNAAPGSRAAWAIISRAKIGLVAACADRMIIEPSNKGGAQRVLDNEPVPQWFWEKFCQPDSSLQKWEVSDFQGKAFHDGGRRTVYLYGVRFDAKDIAKIPGQPGGAKPTASPAAAAPPAMPEKNKGGRKISEAWPDFVAELVAHIHEVGVPEGKGSEGSDTLIDTILSKMMERGLEGPSRATLQPAVKAALIRLRS